MMDGQREPLKPEDRLEQQASSAGDSVAGRGGSRRMLLLGIVFLCVIAAGVSAAVLSSPGGGQAGYIVGPEPNGSQAGHVAGTGNSPAATKAPSAPPTATKTRSAQPTAPPTSSRAITGANVTSKGVAKSALQWPPQLQRQMLRWWKGSGGAALTTVETQMGNAMQAAGLKMYSPMRVACVSVASGISTAQTGPPIPDDVMQQLYARTLTGLSRAAADCRAAISVHPHGDEDVDIDLNKGLLNQSRAEFAAMSKKLYTATAEIQALGR
jgi:hypothetical protein